MAGASTWAATRVTAARLGQVPVLLRFRLLCVLMSWWAVVHWHFGQAPAGSPLNCIALCLLRHAGRAGALVDALRKGLVLQAQAGTHGNRSAGSSPLSALLLL
jgi:hypothetical protein